MKALSRASRIVAFALAAIWLAAGAGALGVALMQQRIVMGAIAAVAIAYGLAWWRVARRSRLLTWRELVAPWRGRQEAGRDVS